MYIPPDLLAWFPSVTPDPLACAHTIPSTSLPLSTNTTLPLSPVYPPTFTDDHGKVFYKCPHPGCDKVYSGKHGRSIWRRHLQDKHNIPLSQQPRRTRWDSSSNRPRSEAERRERTLESKRRWAKKNRAARKAQNLEEDMSYTSNNNTINTPSSSSTCAPSSSSVPLNMHRLPVLEPIKIEFDDRLSAHTPTPPSSSSLPLSFEPSLATPPVPPPAHQPNISIIKAEHIEQYSHFPPPSRRSPFKDLDANLGLHSRPSPIITDRLFKPSDRLKRPGPTTSSPPRKHVKTFPMAYSPTPNSSFSLTPSLSPGLLSTPKSTPLRPAMLQKKRTHTNANNDTNSNSKESDHDAVFGLLALKTVSSPVVECDDDVVLHSVPSSPARFEFSDYGEKRMLGSPITENNRSIFQRRSSTPPSRKRVCDDLFNISGDDDCDYGKAEKLRYSQYPQLSSPAHPEMSKSLGLVPQPRSGISDQWYRPSPRRDTDNDTSLEY